MSKEIDDLGGFADMLMAISLDVDVTGQLKKSLQKIAVGIQKTASELEQNNISDFDLRKAVIEKENATRKVELLEGKNKSLISQVNSRGDTIKVLRGVLLGFIVETNSNK